MHLDLRERVHPFMLLGILASIAVAIAYLSGVFNAIALTSSIVVVSVAALMSYVGLNLFAREGILTNDRFQMMHTNLSITLLFFSISEIVAIGVEFLPDPAEFQIAIGLIQLIGTIFWVEGCLFYIYFTNHTLEFSNRRLIVPLILILSILPYIGIETIILTLTGSLSSKLMVSVPLEILLTSILISQTIILWYFRKGYFSLPILMSLVGNSIILARVIIWTATAMTFAHPVLQVTAALGYWFLGFSLFLTKKSEDI